MSDNRLSGAAPGLEKTGAAPYFLPVLESFSLRRRRKRGIIKAYVPAGKRNPQKETENGSRKAGTAGRRQTRYYLFDAEADGNVKAGVSADGVLCLRNCLKA